MSEASTQEQSLILCKGKTEAANAGNLTNDLKVSGEHPERQKRPRTAPTAAPAKRHKPCTYPSPPSSQEEQSWLASDCTQAPLSKTRSTHQQHHHHHPSVPSLSLSCDDSDLICYAAAASNAAVNDDLEPSASSPRQRSPTPASPNPAPTSALDPELLRLLHALRASEATSPIDPTFLASRHSPAHLPATTHIDASMRALCVSWMIEVTAEFQLSQDTLHLAVSTLDRFLSTTRAVPRAQLQLVSVACLLVAAKHEEELHPSAADLAAMAANSFTPGDLVRMESLVLSCLKFRLACPTSHTFLSIYKGLLRLSPELHSLAAYFIELSMLEYSMLEAMPSVLAAGAVVLAAGHRGDKAVLWAMNQILPGINVGCAPCLGALQALSLQAEEAAKSPNCHTPFSPVLEKFCTERWHRAALVLHSGGGGGGCSNQPHHRRLGHSS